MMEKKEKYLWDQMFGLILPNYLVETKENVIIAVMKHGASLAVMKHGATLADINKNLDIVLYNAYRFGKNHF